MHPLDENNYILVRNFIPRQEAEQYAQELYQLESTGFYTKDKQAPSSPAFYNFFSLIKLLVKKVPHVSELCGDFVLPTYTYTRIYKNGEVLKRHRDRDACEVSLTLNLQKDVDWPIWVQKPNGDEVSLELNPGDAVLYLGCIADHWREAYQGTNFVQAFMHYVKADGPKAYAYFDNKVFRKEEFSTSNDR